MTFSFLFPHIQFSKTSTEGNFKKHLVITKSFLSPKGNSLFTNKKAIPITMYNKSIKEKEKGFLLELLFHGFNFSSRRLKINRLKYSIDTHKSELFICYENETNSFKSRIHKRRLLFFSYDKYLLKNMEETIKKFKMPDVYTGKGIFERNDPYIIKHRKKRK